MGFADKDGSCERSSIIAPPGGVLAPANINQSKPVKGENSNWLKWWWIALLGFVMTVLIVFIIIKLKAKKRSLKKSGKIESTELAKNSGQAPVEKNSKLPGFVNKPHIRAKK